MTIIQANDQTFAGDSWLNVFYVQTLENLIMGTE